MVSHTKLRMTLEQAAALRVIFKLEFVGKTGDLLKKSKEIDDTHVLSHVVRNSEIWSRLDTAISTSMTAAYRKDETALNIDDAIEVLVPQGMLEVIQNIIKEGEYKETLVASKANQQAQITMGAMVHIVIIERNLEAIKQILKIEEKGDTLTFFPMKRAEGKN
jgi:hypothetical protein